MRAHARAHAQQQHFQSRDARSGEALSANSTVLAQMQAVDHEEQGGYLDGLMSGSGLDAALEGALAEAFGQDVSQLSVSRASRGQADALGARAFCQGSRMSFGPDVDLGAHRDARAMGTVAHEVAHALAPTTTPRDEVDQAGDPGEALADRAGRTFGEWMASGARGPAPRLASARGGQTDDRSVRTRGAHHTVKGTV